MTKTKIKASPLPYVRTIEYLSPSSLKMFESEPVNFYLRKLGPEESKPADEEQGFPAAVGTAFDAAVKLMLSSTLGLKCPPLEEMLKKVTTEKERACAMGYSLLVGYMACGAMSALMAEGPTGVEVHPEARFAPGTRVPIKGQLDATLKMKKQKQIVIHDWKVSGANRPGEVSPRKGYARLWDSDTPGVARPAHKDYGIPFEEIDEHWATQLTIYGWNMGHPLKELLASIDEVCVGKDGRVRVAQFRSHVGLAFQRKVKARLVSAWARIKNNDVVPGDLAAFGLDFVRAYR